MRCAEYRMSKCDTRFWESNLLMDIELPENLCGVQKMLVLKDSAEVSVPS
jgi:hypothetical protein